MTRWIVAGALAVNLTYPAVIPAQQASFEAGNRLYQGGDFEAARDAYLQVYDAGLESGVLYYNLGNAYFKTGDLARAILNYERAARLLPRDQDVRANLALARSLTPDEIMPLPRFWLLSAFDWWLELIPRAALIWFVAVAYLVGGAGVVVLILARRPLIRRVSRIATLGAGSIVLVFGSTLAVRESGLTRAQEAVIMVAAVSAQSAPSQDPNLTVFDVHAGTKVRIDRFSDGWAEIVLEDGRVGWIRSESLETI